MRPAPIVKWPTSEPPIVFLGRPTASESVFRRMLGYFFRRFFIYGVLARVTALYFESFPSPYPSRIMSRALFI